MLSSLQLSLPLLGFGLICLVLALAVFRRPSLPVKWRYSFVMLAMSILIIEYFFELNSQSLSSILFWNDLEYIESASLAPLFFLFVLKYIGRERWLAKGKVVLLFIIPAIVLILLWTNDAHHLFYTYVGTTTWGPFTVFSGIYGPAFWIYAGYTHFLTLLSAMLLIYTYLTSSQLYRPQVRIVLIASFLPIASHLISLYNLAPLPPTYLSAILLTATGLLIFRVISLSESPDPVPLALDTIYENMKDGVLVLDAKMNVVHANSAAERYLEKSSRQLTGKPLGLEYRHFMAQIEASDLKDPEDLEICRTVGSEKRFYHAQLSTLRNHAGMISGYILVLRDITEEKMVKEALRAANSKLNLLSSLTRHDVLNQLTALKGYNELLSNMNLQDGKIQRYLHGMMESSSAIEKFIKFTREYQDLGMKTPRWQYVNDAVLEAMVDMSVNLPKVEVETETLEIFADLMLPRVFYNLIENSINHGKHATKIRVRAQLEDHDIIIIYEDNGVGIPFDLKQKIFDPGFGVHTGLGLYVSKEILGITECSITENGVPGEGARFEIKVPAGRWRYRS